MSTLLFIWLRAYIGLNSIYDTYFACLLLALEGPAYLRIWFYLRNK